MLYAHSVEGRPESEWEPLEAHLLRVAELAARFAAAFKASEWGHCAGIWHDMGKALPSFQSRLRGARLQVEHAGVGSAFADSKGGVTAASLAFAIAGHHGGLANKDTRCEGGPTPLGERLQRNRPLLTSLPSLPGTITSIPSPPLPAWLQEIASGPGSREKRSRKLRLSVEMFTRFLFSALVDADRLATEEFVAPNALRARPWPPLDQLSARLDQFIAGVQRESDPSTRVNACRNAVLSACRGRAADARGAFSLTVPTGGGKTLSAMSFALRHALVNGLRRVIVVIPYTSIIEQNAAAYRKALGADAVVEHHTNFDEEAAREECDERETRRKLAVENWDAPIIVTTNVQFLETLFTNRASKARKLHNVSNSVIVMDEVQTLPPGFLAPILDALTELKAHYNCSIVLTTATPPALAPTAYRSLGLEGIREIVQEPAALARELRRVRVRWRDGADGTSSWDALASELVAQHNVLAVVHRRDDARQLAQLLPSDGRFHLSAAMCPAHRAVVLQRVRTALKGSGPCRLISTQLVEAGVDIDFPVVYRALAGLDSLAQAAGRCNREGRLRTEAGEPKLGDFVIFRAQSQPPPGVLRMARDVTENLLRESGTALDIHDPAVYERFFHNLYFLADSDVCGIEAARAAWHFADVGRDFRLIDDFTEPVIVPWGDACRRLATYRDNPARDTRRALQRFVVTVPRRRLEYLRAEGAIDDSADGVVALAEGFEHLYSDEFGLTAATEISADPDRYVI